MAISDRYKILINAISTILKYAKRELQLYKIYKRLPLTTEFVGHFPSCERSLEPTKTRYPLDG